MNSNKLSNGLVHDQEPGKRKHSDEKLYTTNY